LRQKLNFINKINVLFNESNSGLKMSLTTR